MLFVLDCFAFGMVYVVCYFYLFGWLFISLAAMYKFGFICGLYLLVVVSMDLFDYVCSCYVWWLDDVGCFVLVCFLVIFVLMLVVYFGVLLNYLALLVVCGMRVFGFSCLVG